MGVFQDRVNTARIEAGYRTPEACAVALEIGISTIRRWEDGTSAAPDSSLVGEFCKLTKVSADWLLGLSNRKGLR